MSKTVDGMEAAFKSMDAAKISKVMDKFAAAFDEMDVKTAVMGLVYYIAEQDIINLISALTFPKTKVASLIGRWSHLSRLKMFRHSFKKLLTST